jgi:hypothetical protein
MCVMAHNRIQTIKITSTSLAAYLFCLLFDREDEESAFLGNVDDLYQATRSNMPDDGIL